MAFFFSTPAEAVAVPARPDLILSRAADARHTELRLNSDQLALRASPRLLGLDPSNRPAFFAERRTPRRIGR